MSVPNIIGIIPARAGSKGVPRKNVRPVGGKPLIARTWEAALSSGALTRLIVSTDDPEVVTLARAAGIDVPFVRPAALASDTASAVDVAEHALAWLADEQGYRPDVVAWLQPTSPLRATEDIVGALDQMATRGASAVVTVCEADHHPLWALRMTDDGVVTPWSGAEVPGRRQELPTAYRCNGALYLVRRELLLARRTFEPDPTLGYVMPIERSLDVDTPWDLYVADLVLRDRAYP
jgi:CMP-N,N'-diacetyllegionaminic acid synthase